MYNFECESVRSVLEDEVAEEDDDEVIVGANEATEETDKLDSAEGTTMASMTISSLWTSAESILPCILLLRRLDCIILNINYKSRQQTCSQAHIN